MTRPPNVGILAIDVYLPPTMVLASELERHDGVVGKYTEGLGQVSLGFVSDAEDVVSLALTCVHSLLEKYGIDPQRIGRLDVGSESNPDRCKSIKSHVMRLLGAAGNNDVEGVDSVHGCYGATAALLNAINWVESSSWDGRLGLVVGADVAAYAPGSPSRATGGAGAVCVLVGANAPLVADPAWRASYSAHTSEFCKPAAAGPYPVFDGAASMHHYMAALDHTYLSLFKRLNRLQQRVLELQGQGQPGLVACFDVTQGILPHVDYFVAHAPFARMVRRAFARLALHDALRTAEGAAALAAAGVAPRWQMMEPDALPGVGYGDKALDKALASACGPALREKVEPAVRVQAQVGNLYCASLYCGLAALWEAKGAQLDGRRVLLFSFGSGTQASLLSFVGRTVPGGEFTLERVASVMGLSQRLAARVPRPVTEYDGLLSQLRDSWGAVPFTPATPPSALPPGTWYLQHVTEQYVRQYDRVLPHMAAVQGQDGGAVQAGQGGRGAGSTPGSPMPCSSEPTTAVGSSLDGQGPAG